MVNGIALAGTDVYAVGSGDGAYCWKNGELIELGVGGSATAVAGGKEMNDSWQNIDVRSGENPRAFGNRFLLFARVNLNIRKVRFCTSLHPKTNSSRQISTVFQIVYNQGGLRIIIQKKFCLRIFHFNSHGNPFIHFHVSIGFIALR